MRPTIQLPVTHCKRCAIKNTSMQSYMYTRRSLFICLGLFCRSLFSKETYIHIWRIPTCTRGSLLWKDNSKWALYTYEKRPIIQVYNKHYNCSVVHVNRSLLSEDTSKRAYTYEKRPIIQVYNKHYNCSVVHVNRSLLSEDTSKRA